jgi:hypothetical protein
MSREDQYDVTVSVAYGGRTIDLGTFDSFSGGEVDSEETKYYPGGMEQQLSLGGRRTVNNFTVGRLYKLDRDHPLMGWLLGGVGKASVTATKTSLTIDDTAVSNPLVYTGTVKTVTPPDHDSQSSDPAVWTMEVTSATVAQP